MVTLTLDLGRPRSSDTGLQTHKTDVSKVKEKSRFYLPGCWPRQRPVMLGGPGALLTAPVAGLRPKRRSPSSIRCPPPRPSFLPVTLIRQSRLYVSHPLWRRQKAPPGTAWSAKSGTAGSVSL